MSARKNIYLKNNKKDGLLVSDFTEKYNGCKEKYGQNGQNFETMCEKKK